MSLNNSGEKCAVCKAYLFDEDDVVYCPECGAPHHRGCYNAIGHCGLEEFHGTEQQYKKAEKIEDTPQKDNTDGYLTCQICGEKYSVEEMMCPNCNTPNMATPGTRVIRIDLTGGVPDDIDLGDGVKTGDAKKFIYTNTQRYLPKFVSFKKGKKVSWNWLAFITPCGWLLSRKMYMLGCIIGALQIAVSMLTVPFIKGINTLDTSSVRNYMEFSNLILDNISLIGEIAFFSAFVATVLDLIIRVVMGVCGDFIYKKRVITTTAHIKRTSDDLMQDYRKKGGVNLFAAVLGYFAVSELPTIIAYTLGLL